MTKAFGSQGFVMFSNSPEYELGLLDNFFRTDIAVKNTILVYSMKSPLPRGYIESLQDHTPVLAIPFEDYNKIEYASAVEALNLGETVMVIKDLHFMLKRLDERLSMMQIKHSCYKKIVIDTIPYVVDPWKFYFPYSFFDKTLLGYSHSYAFEAAARNHEEDKTLPDPYDPIVLADKVYGVTFLNYTKVFTFEVAFNVYSVTEDELLGYEELKEKLFSTETSIKRIISKLHGYASSLIPNYNVPLKLDCLYGWKGPVVEIHRTNLRVDDYLCSELVNLINRSNALTERLCGD